MKQIIARILATANTLDKKGQYKEADILTKIAQEIDKVNESRSYWRVTYIPYMENPEAWTGRFDKSGRQDWYKDTIKLKGPLDEQPGLFKIEVSQMPHLSYKERDRWEIPKYAYTDENRIVLIWGDEGISDPWGYQASQHSDYYSENRSNERRLTEQEYKEREERDKKRRAEILTQQEIMKRDYPNGIDANKMPGYENWEKDAYGVWGPPYP